MKADSTKSEAQQSSFYRQFADAFGANPWTEAMRAAGAQPLQALQQATTRALEQTRELNRRTESQLLTASQLWKDSADWALGTYAAWSKVMLEAAETTFTAASPK